MAQKSIAYTFRLDGTDVAVKSLQDVLNLLTGIEGQINKTGKGFDTAQFGKLNKALNETERQARRLPPTILTFEEAVRTAARTVVSRFTNDVITSIKRTIGSIREFGADSIRTFADFDKAISNVAALTQGTAEQIEQLRQQAKDLGSTTAFTAQQAAEAQAFLAQAGFDTTEIYQALPGVLDLAAAGQLDLAKAADIASNVLSGLNLETQEISRVNDVLAKTAATANTNVEQLGQAFKNAGPAVANAGGSIEEASAAIGLLGNAGIQGGKAGTDLRNIFLRLQAPTAKAAATLQQLGIQTTDANGKFVGLTSILDQFGKANASTAQLVEVFGARAQGAFSILQNAGAPALQELTTELQNAGGFAKEVGEQQLDNLAGDFTKLQSAIEGTKIAIGEALNPTLRSLTQLATDLVGGLTSLITGQELTTNQSEAFRKVLLTLAEVLATVAALYLTLTKRGQELARNLGQQLTKAYAQATAQARNFNAQVSGANGAFQSALKGLKLFTNGIRVLGRAILTSLGPAAAIFIIFELIDAFTELSAAQKAALETQEQYNKALATAAEETRKAQAAANELFTALKATNTEQDAATAGTEAYNAANIQRQAIIAQINQQYGDYLGNLLTEASSLREIEAAQIEVNAALAASNDLRARQQLQQETNKTLTQTRVELEALARQAGVSTDELVAAFRKQQAAEEEAFSARTIALSAATGGLFGLGQAAQSASIDLGDIDTDKLEELVAQLDASSAQAKILEESINDLTRFDQPLAAIAGGSGTAEERIDAVRDEADRLRQQLLETNGVNFDALVAEYGSLTAALEANPLGGVLATQLGEIAAAQERAIQQARKNAATVAAEQEKADQEAEASAKAAREARDKALQNELKALEVQLQRRQLAIEQAAAREEITAQQAGEAIGDIQAVGLRKRIDILRRFGEETVEVQRQLLAQEVSNDALAAQGREAELRASLERRLQALQDSADQELRILKERQAKGEVTQQQAAFIQLNFDQRVNDQRIQILNNFAAQSLNVTDQIAQAQAKQEELRLAAIERQREAIKQLEAAERELAEATVAALEQELAEVDGQFANQRIDLIRQIAEERLALVREDYAARIAATQVGENATLEEQRAAAQQRIALELELATQVRKINAETSDAVSDEIQQQLDELTAGIQEAASRLGGAAGEILAAFGQIAETDAFAKLRQDIALTKEDVLGLVAAGLVAGQQLAQALNDVLQASSEARLEQLDEAIEEQQERLEEANEEAEASLERIGELEGNLTNARAEDRDRILEQLAQERKAQNAAAAAAKRAAAQAAALEAEKAELQAQAARRQKAFRLVDAIVNTAAAVAQTLASVPAPANFALAAVAGALGAAQVGIIAAQPIPEFAKGGFVPSLAGSGSDQGNAPSFAQGGYTSGGTKQVAGVVHGGEFVVPARMVQSPTYGPVVQQLNTARVRGYQDGGVVGAPSGAGVDVSQLADRLDASITRLAERPVFVEVSQIDRKMQERNASRARATL